MLPQTPCRRVPLPKIERQEMRFLSPAEVWKLADAIRPDYRALILLGAFGGLRIGEMAGLRRGRVEDLVFVGPHGGALRVTLFRQRFWLPAVKAAGLNGLRIHDLRHTAVALWIAAGANPKEVAARAGHASVSFTLDRYGHLYPEADLNLRERLDAIWSASGGGQ
jgi:integrase